MGEDAYEILPGLCLCHIQFGLDILQRYQPVSLASGDDLGGCQRQLVFDVINGEGNQLPPTWNGIRN